MNKNNIDCGEQLLEHFGRTAIDRTIRQTQKDDIMLGLFGNLQGVIEQCVEEHDVTNASGFLQKALHIVSDRNDCRKVRSAVLLAAAPFGVGPLVV